MGKRRLTQNTLIFSAATLASRILGFIRDMLIAHHFGATAVTDAFFVAFRIPNLFRRLLGEGALSSSFIPIFAREEKYKNDISHVIDSAFWSLLIVLTALLIIGEVFTRQLVFLIAPGFTRDSKVLELTVKLTRITFPYIFFMGIAILLGAALNYKKDFFYTSISPCLLNLSFIVFIIYVCPKMKEPVYGLAWAVFTGGILQLGLHTIGAKSLRMLPRSLSKPFSEPVKTALKLMAPATAGFAIHQINTFVDTVLASLLATGSISFLYYANRLFQLPLALFGIATGAVLLPYAADYVARGETEKLIDNTKHAIELVIFLTVPAAIGLTILSFPIVDLLFRRGTFTVIHAKETAFALAMYAIGLPVISITKVIVSLFHAHMDMKTPVKAAAIALLANIVFNLLLIHPMKHAGLALGTSLAAAIQLGYLMANLWKHGLRVEKLLTKKHLITGIWGCFSIVVIILISKWLPYKQDQSLLQRLVNVGTYIISVVGIHTLGGIYLLKILPSWYKRKG